MRDLTKLINSLAIQMAHGKKITNLKINPALILEMLSKVPGDPKEIVVGSSGVFWGLEFIIDNFDSPDWSYDIER